MVGKLLMPRRKDVCPTVGGQKKRKRKETIETQKGRGKKAKKHWKNEREGAAHRKKGTIRKGGDKGEKEKKEINLKCCPGKRNPRF